MIVTSLFPHPCAFINPFSSFAWLGRERNSAVADSVGNVLKSAISWHANFPLFSKGFGGAVLDRHFYSPVSKKKQNKKWQLLKEVAALFSLGSLPGMQQKSSILLKSLLTGWALVLELDAPFAPFSAEVCVKTGHPHCHLCTAEGGKPAGVFHSASHT